MTTLQSATRRTILESVRRGRAATRSDLSLLTGLSRSVVAQTVSELVAEGLLTEHDATRRRELEPVPGPVAGHRRGRPSTLLRAGRRRGWVAGIDLGHRHVSVALGDLHYRVVRERRTPFLVDADAAETLAVARAMLDDALARHRVPRHELLAVSLSVPFPVVGPFGTVEPLGEVPGWAGVRPRELLCLPAGTTLVTENNADLGAWGELVREPDPRVRSLLYVKVGDGLGAGLVVDGQVFSGSHGVGGEIGHVVVPGCTARCRCGRTGCLDALVTQAAGPAATPRDLRAAGEAVGRTLAQLASFVDPDVVVLGGVLGSGSATFAASASAAYAEHGTPYQRAALRPSRLGLRAELWGALDRATQEAWAGIRPGGGRIPAVH